MSFPYSYISCPCADVSIPTDVGNAPQGDEDEEQERTFDPSSQRANYSLYPLEHLMYCEDCQRIRCPRCTVEEIVCWYCPTCIFEMPASILRGDGYRCNRNCFNCPICAAPLTVNTSDPEGHVLSGPWVVVCGYCNWTSLDIGIKFDKPSNLAVQLAMLNNGGTPRAIYSKNPSQEIEYTPHAAPDNDPDSKFHTLKSFLSSQFSRSSSSSNPLLSPSGGDYNYSSPSSLARIMTIYSGNLGPYSKKPATKPIPVRESSSPSEGLHIIDPASDAAAIQKLRTEGWAGTASVAQRAEQRHPPRFIDDIRPVAQILRTKRSKRCRTCRHILVKPEPKITSTRFRIRLVALNYIPTISLKPLQSTGQPAIDLNALPSLRATQFLFTLKNPMFDAVKITLATPSHTPGRHSHKVTILCPQFEIGANTDAWDEALSGGDAAVKRSSKLVASRSNANDPTASNSGESKVAEAGKVWEKGRNWTTVVVEVVCAGIGEDAETVEDGDVVEIPVFIRMEWEGEAAEGEKGGKEKRELAYWAVVGVGRVGRSKEKALD